MFFVPNPTTRNEAGYYNVLRCELQLNFCHKIFTLP